MATKMGFTYSLKVDEKQSLKNLKDSIKNIQLKKSDLSIPVNLKINTTIPREMISSANEALKKKALSLPVDLKINSKSLTNNSIKEAQKILNEKNKQLAMTVGLKIDDKALKKVKDINEVFKETKNTVDNIVNNVSKLAGTKIQVTGGANSSGVRQTTKTTTNSNTKDLEKEIELQQRRLQLEIDALKRRKEYEYISQSIISDLERQNSQLGVGVNSFQDLRENATYLSLQIKETVNEASKLIRIEEEQKKSEKETLQIIKEQNAQRDIEVKHAQQLKTISFAIKKILEGQNGKYVTEEEITRLNNLKASFERLKGVNLQTLNNSLKGARQEINEISYDANIRRINDTSSAFQQLGKSLQKLGIYVSSAGAIRALWTQLRKGVVHIKDVDTAFTNMSMTMQTLTKDTFNDMLSQVNTLSKNMGAVSSEVLKIAQTFANDSTTIEEVMAKLQSSTALMNVSGMDATEVTKSIMSIANSYQLLEEGGTNAAEVTEYLGDVLTKTSANMSMDFVEGMQGLINGIGVAGSTMKAAGVDMEWYVGMLGNIMVATGQSADVLGRSMRTITARVMQQKQALEEMGESVEDVEIAMAKGEKALNELGIRIRDDLSGELRSFSDIMDDLGARWDGLTDSTKYYLAEQLAGKNQMDVFIGMMDSYEEGLKLVNNAYDAQGALMEMNGIYAESLQGKLNTLTSSQQELYQTIVNSNTFKGTIDALTSIVNGITSIIDTFGLMPSVIAIATSSFLTFSNTGNKIRDGLLNAIKETNVSMQTLGTTSTGTIGKFKAFSTQLIATQGQIVLTTIKTVALQAAMSMGISVAIGLAISAFGKLFTMLKNSQPTLENITNKMNDVSSALDNYNNAASKLQEVKVDTTSIKEMARELENSNTSQERQEELTASINELLSKHSSSYSSIAGVLNDENISLETRVKLLERQAELEEKSAQKDVYNNLKDNDILGGIASGIDTQISKINHAYGVIENLSNREGELSLVSQKSLETQQKALTEAIDSIEEYALKTEVAKAQLESLKLGGFIDDAEYKKFMQQYDSIIEALQTLSQQYGLNLDVFKDSSDVNNYGEATKELTTNLEGLKRVAEDLTVTNDDLAESSRSATEEYLQACEELEEAKALLADINKNGMNLDNAKELFEGYEDFTGNINSASDAQQFLNDKILEMENAHAQAYSNMLRNDEEFWNSKMKNSEEWKNFVNGTNEEIRNFGLKVLGEETQDYVDFINERLNHRQVDLQNAKTMAEAENVLTKGLVSDLSSYFVKLTNDKGSYRAVDYSNIIKFLNQQGVAEVQTIQQLKELWQAYYQEKWKALDTELKSLESKLDVVYEGDRENIYSNFHALQQENNKMQNLFNSLDLSFKGVSGSLGQATVSGGSLSKPSSSSSSSSSDSKDVDDLELEIDRYYQLNDALDDVNNQLNKLRAQRERITSADEYRKSLDAEKNLLNENLQALKNLHAEQNKELGETRNFLQNNGFTFDGNGNIKNYASKLKALQDAANRLSGEAKENAIANVKHIASMIERYTELSNSAIPSTELSIIELEQAIKDLNKEYEEKLKLIERLGNRYFDLEQAIRKVDNALSLNQAKQETATAQEKVDLIQEEIELLKQKQKLIEQNRNEVQQEANEIRESLSKQGVAFDDKGNITNYQAIIKKLTDEANKLVGTARDEAVETLEELIEKMEEYSDLTNETLPELETQWQEYVNQMKEAERNKLEMIADVEKQITNAIKSEWQKRTEITKNELQKQKDELNKQYEEEDYQDELKKEQRKLEELQQQIDNISRDNSLAGQLKLQDLMQQYQDQQEVINNMIKDWEREQANNRLDEEMEKLDQEMEEALTPENLSQLVASALQTGLVTVGDEIIRLDDLMADFAVEAEGAITSLATTIRAEMVQSLQEAKLLIESLGSSYRTLIGYNESFAKGVTLSSSEIQGRSMSPSIEFNAPLLTIQGDIVDGMQEGLDEVVARLQDVVLDTVSNALATT